MRSRERGFTLIEVLITVVVAGVLGAALMSLVLGQQKFYGQSEDAVIAQQNIRASLDLMGAELRMAGPSDILAADADSVAVRSDILRGVICRMPNSDQAYVFVYDTVATANLPGGVRGTAYSNPYDSAWVYEPGFTPSSSVSNTAQTVCVTQKGAPSTRPLSDFRDTNGWTAFAAPPDEGALVRWYGRLAYRLSPSGSDPNAWAIWRSGQELVTPFATSSRFRYVMANGSVRNSVGAGQLDQIRQIRVEVTAIGDANNRYGVNRPIVYDIPLRNCTANC